MSFMEVCSARGAMGEDNIFGNAFTDASSVENRAYARKRLRRRRYSVIIAD
jgi:hypothetical protein